MLIIFCKRFDDCFATRTYASLFRIHVAKTTMFTINEDSVCNNVNDIQLENSTKAPKFTRYHIYE